MPTQCSKRVFVHANVSQHYQRALLEAFHLHRVTELPSSTNTY
nr:MAG TPA: hypothetical protein [Caudoviricetes sp.]